MPHNRPDYRSLNSKPGCIKVVDTFRTLLVSCADKLHNARAIAMDLRTHGPAMLQRFSAPPGGTAWYYQALAEVFARRLPGPLARELALATDELAGLAAR